MPTFDELAQEAQQALDEFEIDHAELICIVRDGWWLDEQGRFKPCSPDPPTTGNTNMPLFYIAQGKHIFLGDTLAATCEQAPNAASLLNEARRLNDKRKYTASACKMREAETLPGFKWSKAFDIA